MKKTSILLALIGWYAAGMGQITLTELKAKENYDSKQQIIIGNPSGRFLAGTISTTENLIMKGSKLVFSNTTISAKTIIIESTVTEIVIHGNVRFIASSSIQIDTSDTAITVIAGSAGASLSLLSANINSLRELPLRNFQIAPSWQMPVTIRFHKTDIPL